HATTLGLCWSCSLGRFGLHSRLRSRSWCGGRCSLSLLFLSLWCWRCGRSRISRRSLFTVLQENGNNRVHLYVVSAFGNQDLTDLAFIDGFHFHGRLVGFNLRNHVAGGDCVPFL